MVFPGLICPHLFETLLAICFSLTDVLFVTRPLCCYPGLLPGFLGHLLDGQGLGKQVLGAGRDLVLIDKPAMPLPRLGIPDTDLAVVAIGPDLIAVQQSAIIVMSPNLVSGLCNIYRAADQSSYCPAGAGCNIVNWSPLLTIGSPALFFGLSVNPSGGWIVALGNFLRILVQVSEPVAT